MSQLTTWGEWWIDARDEVPERYVPPQHTVAGALHAEGFADWRLETIGAVDGGTRVNPNADPVTNERQSIWGTDAEGWRYSLLGAEHAFSEDQSWSVRGGVQEWHVRVIARSREMFATLDTQVDRLSIHMRDLESWTGGSTPNLHHDISTGTVTSPTDDHVVIAEANKKTVELRSGTSWSSTHNSAGKSVSFTPSATISIEGNQPIGEIQEQWLWPMRKLFSLFSMRPCVVDLVNARVLESHNDGNTCDEDRAWLEVRFPQALNDDHASTGDSDPLGSHEMLATVAALAEAGVGFDRLLPVFLDTFHNSWADTALECLVASQEKQRGFVFDDMLLFAVKGIESLNAHHHGTDPQASTPRIPTLNMVTDYLDTCGSTADAIRQTHPNIAEAIKEARDAVAHPRVQLQNTYYQVALLNAIQWLLRHGLLRAIGLTSSACDTIITKNFVFKREMRQLERGYAWTASR